MMPPATAMRALDELIGEHPTITGIRDQFEHLLASQVAGRRMPAVLIQGETGTGKGLLARAIHRDGPRAAGPFVGVNCAAIPETLLEAEMFGFERGAFTDARQAKPGLFQAAHRGTIFLDEVGLLPEGLQGKLLKVIEDQEVRRLGSTRSEPVDVAIVAATSEDLTRARRERRFQEALYHRLAVLTITLPPLRARGHDVLLLAEHLLARACTDYHVPPKTFSPEARPALLAYPWPGNVRELANVIERLTLLVDGPVVSGAALGLPAPGTARATGDDVPTAVPLVPAVSPVEREALLEVLKATAWNVSRAAARLGVSRNTLRYRIEKYGLRPGVRSTARPGPREAPPTPTPASLPAESEPVWSIRWEHRALTLLRARLLLDTDAAVPADAQRTLELLVEKVRGFGGRVAALGRTSLVAAFGVDAAEDATVRAALAALAMQRATEQSGRHAPGALGIAVGIHTDQFLVGRAPGMVEIDLDDRRRAEARLDELVDRAGTNTIAVTEAAAPFLRRRFGLIPGGTPERAPGRSYRLVASGAAGAPGSGSSVPFVGRDQELELLAARLGTARAGQGQVVGIVGEAGIGKSRLLAEFRGRLADAPVTYLEGRCVSYGTTSPYLPVLDLVRQHCGVTENDPPDVVAARVRASLEALGLHAGDDALYVTRLLGAGDDAESLDRLSAEVIKARTFEALRRICLSAARQRTLVVAVEDLHWIDTASQEYLASLVESLGGASALLLFTYRPGYHPPWIDRSYVSQLTLKPLGRDDSLTVVRAALRGEPLPEVLADVILDRAEGNPFFLEELARAAAEHGGHGQTLAVPDTVEGVLMARIDRLADAPRRLLQTAAVLGREFPLRLLTALAPAGVDATLAELRRLEFLHEAGDADEPLYVFKHALTQEVTYTHLPPAERVALHAAAGRALESLFAGRLSDVADRLAYHFARTDDAERAVTYLVAAAERSARGSAHVEAVGALQEAIAHVERLAPDTRDRRYLDVLLRAAFSLSVLGRFREIVERLLAQRERLERIADPSVAGPYHFRLGLSYTYLGDQERAAEHALRAIEEAGRCGDRPTLGKGYYVLALSRYWAGRFAEGLEYGRHAIARLEQTSERHWLGLTYWVVGLHHFHMGEFDPALEAEARAGAVGEAVGDPRLQAFAAWSTGWICATRGDWAQGIEACEQALARSPDPVTTALALSHLGYAYLEAGRPADAVHHLERSAALFEQFRLRQLHGRSSALLAEALLALGRLERARELALQGLELTRQSGYRYGLAWALRALGRVEAARGVPEDAERHFHGALETFAAIEARFELARTHLALAEFLERERRLEAVRNHATLARALFTALALPRFAARCEAITARA